MAKQKKSKNSMSHVQETQGKVKYGKEKFDSNSAETVSLSQTIYNNKSHVKERPISSVYPVIDTDLARDNHENDLTEADFQDL